MIVFFETEDDENPIYRDKKSPDKIRIDVTKEFSFNGLTLGQLRSKIDETIASFSENHKDFQINEYDNCLYVYGWRWETDEEFEKRQETIRFNAMTKAQKAAEKARKAEERRQEMAEREYQLYLKLQEKYGNEQKPKPPEPGFKPEPLGHVEINKGSGF